MIEYQQAPEAVSTEDRDLTAKAEFAQSVQTMSRGLCRVLDDTIKVANVKQKEDANTIAELYYEIVKVGKKNGESKSLKKNLGLRFCCRLENHLVAFARRFP
jgi:hypothetical protein